VQRRRQGPRRTRFGIKRALTGSISARLFSRSVQEGMPTISAGIAEGARLVTGELRKPTEPISRGAMVLAISPLRMPPAPERGRPLVRRRMPIIFEPNRSAPLDAQPSSARQHSPPVLFLRSLDGFMSGDGPSCQERPFAPVPSSTREGLVPRQVAAMDAPWVSAPPNASTGKGLASWRPASSKRHPAKPCGGAGV
jgi:hypothetical protein